MKLQVFSYDKYFQAYEMEKFVMVGEKISFFLYLRKVYFMGFLLQTSDLISKLASTLLQQKRKLKSQFYFIFQNFFQDAAVQEHLQVIGLNSCFLYTH